MGLNNLRIPELNQSQISLSFPETLGCCSTIQTPTVFSKPAGSVDVLRCRLKQGEQA